MTTQRERLAMILAGPSLGGAGIGRLAVPSSLPPFQIPGMPGAPPTPGMPPFTAQNPVLPPTTVAAPPLPPPQAAPPPPAAPPEMPPSLAIASAPGMSQMPQTGTQLEEWRKLMDALQFARQGQ